MRYRLSWAFGLSALCACQPSDDTVNVDPAGLHVALLHNDVGTPPLEWRGVCVSHAADGATCSYDDGMGTLCIFEIDEHQDVLYGLCSGDWGTYECEATGERIHCTEYTELGTCIELYDDDSFDLVQSTCFDAGAGGGVCARNDDTSTAAYCGEAEVTSFVVSGTTFTARGRAPQNAREGLYHVRNSSGGEISGPIHPDVRNGDFVIHGPLLCGEQVVKIVFCTDSCDYESVFEVSGRSCTASSLQVTLSWDSLGMDWELHLVREDGRINDPYDDCTWTTCISSSPDWGVLGDASDDPRKDIDDLDEYGPENIYLDNAPPGRYTVLVEHWGQGSSLSDGRVIINLGGVATVAEIANLAYTEVWTVGTIEVPSGLVTTDTSVYDCSGDWYAGCQAAIPTP